MNTEPYELMDGYPGWIKVCAWCYPGEKIFDLFPDLRGQQISHTICPAHYKKSMAGIFSRCDGRTTTPNHIGDWRLIQTEITK
jgi:hypothetical protein